MIKFSTLLKLEEEANLKDTIQSLLDSAKNDMKRDAEIKAQGMGGKGDMISSDVLDKAVGAYDTPDELVKDLLDIDNEPTKWTVRTASDGPSSLYGSKRDILLDWINRWQAAAVKDYAIKMSGEGTL